MPKKEFLIDGDLLITVIKRRGNRNLRLSIGAGGLVRVSIPAWAPYKAGIEFAKSRQQWIREQRRQPDLLIHGQAIGKAHHLEFVPSETAAKVSGRQKGSAVVVTHSLEHRPSDPEVQKAAREASVRALRAQAESLLPQRLAALANKHGFKYGQVSVKRLKGRWGSCDQQGNIVLNLFLMQLPWELIDYVLLHELTHTVVLRHGSDFWQAMEKVSADSGRHRKAIRKYQPVLNSLI